MNYELKSKYISYKCDLQCIKGYTFYQYVRCLGHINVTDIQ